MSISKFSTRGFERSSHGEVCFEYLKFQSCSVQAKFGIHCPYAHSLYELHKFKFKNKEVERKTYKSNKDKIYNPDAPNENQNIYIPKLLTKLDLCKDIINFGICQFMARTGYICPTSHTIEELFENQCKMKSQCGPEKIKNLKK